MENDTFLKRNSHVAQTEKEGDFNDSEDIFDEEDDIGGGEFIGNEEDDYRNGEERSEDGEYESSFIDDSNVNEEDEEMLRNTLMCFKRRVGGSAFDASPSPKRLRDF